MPRLPRRAYALVVLAVAGVVLSGCGVQKLDATRAVSTSTVTLPPSYRFSPDVITVHAGTTVTWTNHDHFTHSVRFGTGPAAGTHVLKPGQSFRARFGTSGTFAYDCSFHPHDMRGEVIVR